jgi:DNA-binding NtrC family response regulator
VPVALIVDDEASIRVALERMLIAMDFEVVTAVDGLEGQQRLRQGTFDLVITDLSMPGADGFEMLRAVRELHPGLPAIVLTALSSTADCVRAMRAGATDFIGKPFTQEQLAASIRAALHPASPDLSAPDSFSDEGHLPLAALIGDSPQLRSAIDQVERVARTDVPALLIGEQGTGKLALARLVHAMSRRVGKPLVVYRCSSTDPGLVERALLGEDNASGQLGAAEGGTLLISHLERIEQALRARLIERLVERVTASSTARHADVRVMVSIDLDPAGEDEAFELAAMLQSRLEAVMITMPPLREREQDMPLLVEHFTEVVNRRLGRKVNAQSLVTALKQYRWPGNLTELEARISKYVTEAPPDAASESHSEPNAFVVPVDRITATLILDDGSRREVVLPRGQRQSIEDVLEAKDAFLPVKEGGGTRIYARSALACIAVSEPRELEDDGLPRKRRSIRVLLRSGVVLEGELRYVAVEGRSRVTDIVNEESLSFPLFSGTIVHHIAKAHVRSIEEC